MSRDKHGFPGGPRQLVVVDEPNGVGPGANPGRTILLFLETFFSPTMKQVSLPSVYHSIREPCVEPRDWERSKQDVCSTLAFHD